MTPRDIAQRHRLLISRHTARHPQSIVVDSSPAMSRTSHRQCRATLRIAMICSLVNLDRFMSGPLVGPDSSIRWTSYRGSQQLHTLVRLDVLGDSKIRDVVRDRITPARHRHADVPGPCFSMTMPQCSKRRQPGPAPPWECRAAHDLRRATRGSPDGLRRVHRSRGERHGSQAPQPISRRRSPSPGDMDLHPCGSRRQHGRDRFRCRRSRH